MTATGLIVPMRSEAFSLLGRRHWRSADGLLRLDVRRDHEIPTICICSGAGPENAAAAADTLIETGVDLLAVTGTAGGLHPALRPGDLVLAGRIFKKDRETVFDVGGTSWEYSRLLLKTPAAVSITRGAVVSCSVVIETPAEKERLYRQTGALAVDMESAAVVQAADRKGLPSVVLRAVCDTAAESLPREILDSINRQGRVHPGRLAHALLRQPTLIPALIRLSAEFSTAMAALKKVLPLII